MTPNDLIAAFDTLADAPDGVKRLRELVLSLAVRGKLVEQAEKERHGRELVSTEPPDDDEVPFEIPRSWTWLRLPEASDYLVGKTPPTKDPSYWSANATPWVSIGDMPDGGTVVSTSRTVSARAVAEVFRRAPAAAGTILMSFKLTIGKVAMLGVDAYHNEAIISITPKPFIDKRFLFSFMPILAAGGETKAAIKGATLNGQSLARILVPVPPLAEQHRIVARVDELMGLLDRLEAARVTRDTVRRAARDAALADLRDAPDAEAVEAAWGRIARQMDDLFTEPEDVGPLRQAVLQLAVRGRLVPQDAEDESASALLERIAVHKARLVKEKKLRKPETLQPVTTDEVPFEVPKGWVWARVEDLVEQVTDGVHQTPTYVSTGVPFLSIKDISAGVLDFSNTRFVTREAHEEMCRRCKPERGDILFCRIGTLGRALVIDSDVEFSIFVSLGLLKMTGFLNSEFMQTMLNSPASYDQYQRIKAGGSHTDKLNLGTMRAAIMPIAPLAEQNRIVAKVDALMALCDTMEARLTAARDLQGQFAAAAVHHLDA